jgi:hypothetical protein
MSEPTLSHFGENVRSTTWYQQHGPMGPWQQHGRSNGDIKTIHNNDGQKEADNAETTGA